MDNDVGGYMIIGSRIKEERIKKNLSQQQLGDLLGVTKVSVCGYENGTRTPTIETFLKIIDILELSPDYILGRDVDVVCEEEEKYTKKLSKEDLDIISEIKLYPKLYNKLCSQVSRTVKLINKKMS